MYADFGFMKIKFFQIRPLQSAWESPHGTDRKGFSSCADLGLQMNCRGETLKLEFTVRALGRLSAGSTTADYHRRQKNSIMETEQQQASSPMCSPRAVRNSAGSIGILMKHSVRDPVAGSPGLNSALQKRFKDALDRKGDFQEARKPISEHR